MLVRRVIVLEFIKDSIMNKVIVHTGIFLCLVLINAGCSNSSAETKDASGNSADTLGMTSPQNEGANGNLNSQKTVVSLTKKEAEQRMEAFVKQNKKKYADYGEIDNLSCVGGNYTLDGALDYFYSVGFYGGGDYVYTTNFFYNSDQDKITELSINQPEELSNDLKSITAKELKEGVVIGTAELFGAFSGEHSASRSVEAEFIIDGDKISYDKKFLPKFLKAKKDIQNELNKMEQELMNGGY